MRHNNVIQCKILPAVLWRVWHSICHIWWNIIVCFFEVFVVAIAMDWDSMHDRILGYKVAAKTKTACEHSRLNAGREILAHGGAQIRVATWRCLEAQANRCETFMRCVYMCTYVCMGTDTYTHIHPNNRLVWASQDWLVLCKMMSCRHLLMQCIAQFWLDLSLQWCSMPEVP